MVGYIIPSHLHQVLSQSTKKVWHKSSPLVEAVVVTVTLVAVAVVLAVVYMIQLPL
jgi:hypothetical protein